VTKVYRLGPADLVDAVLAALPDDEESRARLGAEVFVAYRIGGKGDDGPVGRPPEVSLRVGKGPPRDVTAALEGRSVWTFLRHLDRSGLSWERWECPP
jgi:hypothetical protein